VFAQAYLGDDGTHYVFITNKSPNPETVALSTGTTLPASVSVITAEAPVTTQSAPLPDPSVSNDPLPAAPMVQASAATPASPTAIAVPGYGVALVSW
jgi:hypothetical protein